MIRTRSPGYPSLSLPQAIELIEKVHRANRSNVISRETAAKDMGYSGLTGRSLTVLAALAQYGLIEKAGKGDIKVSRRAVDILHSVEPGHRIEAIRDSANAPSLFKSLRERFPDGIPSQNAIRSYLIQLEYADIAIGSVITAFLETNDFLERESAGQQLEPSSGLADQPLIPPSTEDLRSTKLISLPYLSQASPETDRVLNKINMNIQGDRVQIAAFVDLKGLYILEKKIIGLKALLEPDASNNEDDDYIG